LRKLFLLISASSAALSVIIWIYVLLNNPLQNPVDGDCANSDCVQMFLGQVGIFGLYMIVGLILPVVSVATYVIARRLNSISPTK
jgi:hypothetical protein